MAATKTKPNLAARIAVLEAEEIQNDLAKQAEIEQLIERLRDLEEAVDLAEIKFESIEDEWRAGNDTISALDHAVANSEKVKAAALFKGTESRIEKWTKSRPNTDTNVAQIASSCLLRAYPGIVVQPTFLKGVNPEDSDGPIALVKQTTHGTCAAGGVISGMVDIEYHRTPLLASIDSRKLERAGEEMGFSTEVITNRNPDSPIQKIRLKVNHASLENPPIPVFAESRFLRMFETNISSAITGELTPRGVAVNRVGHAQHRSHYVMITTVHSQPSEQVADDGGRVGTVDMTLTVQRLKEFEAVTSSQVANVLRDLDGVFIAGLGKILSAEMVTTDLSVALAEPLDNSVDAVREMHGSQGRSNLTIRFTFGSTL